MKFNSRKEAEDSLMADLDLGKHSSSVQTNMILNNIFDLILDIKEILENERRSDTGK